MTKLLSKLALLALVAALLLGCSPCDPSTQPCDTDLSTRNQQRYNAPVDKEWCVWGAELVPCNE